MKPSVCLGAAEVRWGANAAKKYAGYNRPNSNGDDVKKYFVGNNNTMIDQTDRRGMTTEKERAFEKGEWRRFLLLKVVYTRDHQRNSPDNGAKKVHNMTQWTKKSKRPPHVSSELPIFQFQWNHQTKTKLVELHMNILYKNLYMWPQSSGQSPRLSAGHPPFTMFQLVVNGKRIERTIGLVPVHTNMQIYSTPDVTVNKPATWSIKARLDLSS